MDSLSAHERWKRRNPAAYLVVRARHRAKKLGLPFSITAADIAVPERCPVLGIRMEVCGPPDTSPSIDRIRPELGYVPGNVVVISKRANTIKRDATLEELRRIAAFYSEIIQQPQIDF